MSSSQVCIESLKAAQSWLYAVAHTGDVIHDTRLMDLRSFGVDEQELPHATGQAAEFLHKLAEIVISAQHLGMAQANHRAKVHVAHLDAIKIKEYFHCWGMAFSHFRELPDHTIVVNSDWDLWFQQRDPEVIQRFHEFVERERELLADLEAENSHRSGDCGS